MTLLALRIDGAISEADMAQLVAALDKWSPTVIDEEPLPVGRFRVRAIVDRVAFETGLTAVAITGRDCRAALFRARCMVAWLSVNHAGRSSAETGRVLGDRDHTTVLHALRRAAVFRDTDPAFRRVTDRIAHAIEQGELA